MFASLREEVKTRIGNLKEPQWHYISRIKDRESIAQKLETGRVDLTNGLQSIDDFFACTLVVENSSKIEEALKRLKEVFVIKDQKPKTKGETHLEPSQFDFDDLRLYCIIEPTGGVQQKEWHNVTFEIQIKTFLQHAWAIATHDLIYKGDQISWGRARVAHQIKAMLEHAEASIECIDGVACTYSCSRTNSQTESQIKILKFVSNHWDEHKLPADKVRLADNILRLLKLTNIDLDYFCEHFDVSLTSYDSLSPYGVVIKWLKDSGKVDSILSRKVKDDSQIYWPQELEMPEASRFFRKNVITLE